MADTCPTLKVKLDNEQGFMVINESDFDAEKHELFEPAEADQDESTPAKRAYNRKSQ